MMRGRIALALLLIGAGFAWADSFSPTLPDMSAYALKTDIPQPDTALPPSEVPGGAAGTSATFRRGDAVQPRITRTSTMTLDAAGTVTFDWTSQGALGTPVQVVVTPIYTGTGVPKCWATSVTATSAGVKCVIETVTVLTIVGINVGSLSNTAPASMPVSVVALPKS